MLNNLKKPFADRQEKNIADSPATYDLAGKTAVITGATSGIGLAAAIRLVKCGARVVAAGRSPESCREAEVKIRKACPGGDITFLPADLSSLSQVRQLASGIRSVLSEKGALAIDILINNAGTVSSWYVATAEGFELQFAVNHLAPFLLTGELLPLLEASPEGRVVTVSSGSHFRTRINWADIMLRRHYSCLAAYKQSKLANVLFTAELNRRLRQTSKVRAFAVDPGLVNTNIGLKGTSGLVRWVWEKRSRGGIAPEIAAANVVYTAAEPKIQFSGSIYWKEGRPEKPSSYAMKEDAAHKLWEVSERMCGLKPRKNS